MSEPRGSLYLVALGSNMRHRRHGDPHGVLRAALKALSRGATRLHAAAPIVSSRPLGPSHRLYANSAAIVSAALPPPAMLAALKAIERDFGRRRGRRWGARVLDLDIILWDGGQWRSRDLCVPHRDFRTRGFVLAPAARIAPRWRDPVTGHNLLELHARLTRRLPLPRPAHGRAHSSVGRATDF